jgi:dolichol-phosphate mannosyltransferase
LADGVSVLVPTLNEADNIDALLDGIQEAAGARFHLEVIVVDDGSTDGTRERVARREAAEPVRLLARDDPQGGLAGAIVDAARVASHETIVIIDGDLSHPPSVIPELVAPVLAGRKDVVIGSRHVAGGGTPDWPLRRKIYSRVAAALAWPLTDARDPMAGFLAMRRDRLLSVDARADGFKIGLEVMAAGGEPPRVGEVPITFRDRRYGQSKMSAGTVKAYLRRLSALAGCQMGKGIAARLAAAAAVAMVVDIVAFLLLLAGGQPLTVAHPLSFSLAAILAYLLNSWLVPTAAVQGGQRAFRALNVGLLAVTLRGGVLALCLGPLGLAGGVAIPAAAACGAVANYLGSLFFVFPAPSVSSRRAIRWRVAALALVGYAVLLRLVYLALPDLMPEEAYYWNYAQHLELGYLDHPPMVAWLIAAGTALFGDTEFGVRIAAPVCWAVAAVFSYRMSLNLFDKATGLIALALVAVLPFLFTVGIFITPDAPLVACWAAMLFFLERALVARKRSAWWGVGAALGLGMLSKYTISLLGPAALLFVIVDRPSRKWLRRPEPYLAILLALVLFSPVIVWNARHEWASFSFQSSRRIAGESVFSLHVLLIDAVIMLTPLGLIALFLRLVRRPPDHRKRRPEGRKRLFLAVFTLVPLSVFVWFSLTRQTKHNWTGPLWLAAVPLIASSIVASIRWRGTRPRGRGWGATFSLTTIALALLLHYLAVGWPGIGYRQKMRFPVGWRELAAQVESIGLRVERETGERPLIVGMDKYFIASELNFYDKVHGPDGVAGCHLFDLDSVMFEYWYPPQQQRGKTMVLVGFDRRAMSKPPVLESLSRLRPIRQHVVKRNGVVVGQYLYRIGYDYQPPE